MIIELRGKQAVVTGSPSGIGVGIARGLAQAGAAVVVNGRSQKNVDAATRRLREEAPQAKVEGIAADLATAAGVAAFIARVGATDVLVNKLGIFDPKPLPGVPH